MSQSYNSVHSRRQLANDGKPYTELSNTQQKDREESVTISEVVLSLEQAADAFREFGQYKCDISP